jgi:hypothetical protein
MRIGFSGRFSVSPCPTVLSWFVSLLRACILISRSLNASSVNSQMRQYSFLEFVVSTGGDIL